MRESDAAWLILGVVLRLSLSRESREPAQVINAPGKLVSSRLPLWPAVSAMWVLLGFTTLAFQPVFPRGEERRNFGRREPQHNKRPRANAVSVSSLRRILSFHSLEVAWLMPDVRGRQSRNFAQDVVYA